MDQSRPETLAPVSGPYRELTAWIGYRADPQVGKAYASYLPGAWEDARNRSRGLSSILFQSTSSIHGHALAGVPLASAEETYPVLIFEPDLGPTVSDYTTLLGDLASHGYIIIGVNPTYGASTIVFSDGRVAEQSASGNIPESAFASDARQIGGELVQVWAGDVRFAIDQAQRLDVDPDSPFVGRLDLMHIGVFGHSFGGAAAAEACHLNARCKAGANLDGYPYGDVIDAGLRQPFLFLWSAGNDADNAYYQLAVQGIDAICSQLEIGYQATIQGTRHFNFTDYAVEFSPALKLLDMLGPIDGAHGLTISEAYVLTFFDAYLKGGNSRRLHELATEFPEVTFEARGD